MNLSENFTEDRIRYALDKEFVPLTIAFLWLMIVVGILGYAILLFVLFFNPHFCQSPSFHFHKLVAIADTSQLCILAWSLLNEYNWIRYAYALCMNNFLTDLSAFFVSKLILTFYSVGSS